MINGSNTGVFSVYLVVIEARIPNRMPIKIPPSATTKKEVMPKTTSTTMMFSWPISAKDANSRYKTLSIKLNIKLTFFKFKIAAKIN